MHALHHAGDVCTVRAHAKVNLSLRILAREDSGYHQIETLFCLVDLADDVEVRLHDQGSDDDVALRIDWEATLQPPRDLGAMEDNLAVRAVRAFRGRTGRAAAVEIMLRKRIPAGAGLGGGSADAAAVLTALNRLHDEPLAMPELLDLAATLGADVPFLVSGVPLALAWGRGTRMMALSPPAPAYAVLLQPAQGMSTAHAYAELATLRVRRGAEPDRALVYRDAGDWESIAALAVNDFEPVVFRHVPAAADALSALQRRKPLLARMTGSGSCVLGVFRERTAAEDAAAAIPQEVDDLRATVARLPVVED